MNKFGTAKINKGLSLEEVILGSEQEAMNEVSDPITEALPEPAKAKYLYSVPDEIRLQYSERLRGTVRWTNDNSGEIVNPEFKENNLDHVVEIINWMNEIKDQHHKLWQEVCDNNMERWIDLFAMIVVHDSGEIVVKDMTRAHTDFHGKNGKRHKRKESIAAGLLIHRYLPPATAEEVIRLYHEFEKKLPGQKLLMFGHTLDKGQATKNVGKHIIPFTLPVNEEKAMGTTENTLNATLTYAQNLARNLSPAARKELQHFLEQKILTHFDKINHDGVQGVYQKVRKEFDLVLGNK